MLCFLPPPLSLQPCEKWTLTIPPGFYTIRRKSTTEKLGPITTQIASFLFSSLLKLMQAFHIKQDTKPRGKYQRELIPSVPVDLKCT